MWSVLGLSGRRPRSPDHWIVVPFDPWSFGPLVVGPGAVGPGAVWELDCRILRGRPRDYLRLPFWDLFGDKMTPK